MRLRQEEIDYTAWRILRKLKEGEKIVFLEAEGDALEIIRSAITEELMVEDRLNREVDDILREHQNEMQGEMVDYRRMFQLIKNKLARERGIII